MIYKRAIYKIKKQSAQKVKRAIRVFVKEIRKNESSTKIYESYQLDDKITFIHYMAFENRRAENIHKNAQYTKKFTSILYPLCTKKPEFKKLFLVDKR